MKIGDLVQLSAHGRKLQQNEMAYGGWGIITRMHDSRKVDHFPIQTKWFCVPKQNDNQIEIICFSRYELKKLKPDTK